MPSVQERLVRWLLRLPYGFVKGYERDYGKFYRDAEVERLAQGAAGVKRTTGQHPGESLLFQTIWMSMTLLQSSIQQMM